VGLGAYVDPQRDRPANRTQLEVIDDERGLLGVVDVEARLGTGHHDLDLRPRPGTRFAAETEFILIAVSEAAAELQEP
jgi:hypothetical protein